MARISFQGKPIQVYNVEGTPAYRYIAVPALARRHCDMAAFRQHPKYHGLANSDLFPNVLARIRRDTFGGKDIVRLGNIPAGVDVDTAGFLATVSWEA